MTSLETAVEILAKWLESLPVMVGLVLTAAQIRNVERAQRVDNHLKVTASHREIRSRLFDNPELWRVLRKDADFDARPVTSQESLFVTFLILHLKTSYRANEVKMLVPAEALRRDIRWFFSLPIPKGVWLASRELQDADFRRFVESALGAGG